MRNWILTFSVCLYAFVSTPVFATPNPVDTSEVDRRVFELMKDPRMAGLALAIIEDGKITHTKGYGETLKGSGDKVTGDTVFRWASVSKGVAAATVLGLADDGHFSLSSPVKAYAPSLHLPKSKYPATIEDVLTHRLGILNNAYDKRIEDGQTGKQVRHALSKVRRLCEPGSCHAYQNAAFDAASEITETVSGIPYKSVVSERFFKPLGMDTASLTLEGLIRSKNWAKPHKKTGQPVNRVKPTYYRIPAAAGINSSVTDLAKWMQAQMNDANGVLQPDTQEALHEGRVSTPNENRRLRRHYPALRNAEYGLGWRTYDYEGHQVVGHRGAVEGYRALTLFDPKIKTGVAIMWNSPHGRPVGLQLEIMDQVYGHPRRDWMRLGQRTLPNPPT